MPRITVICEDSYGKEFFKRIVDRMKQEELIPSHIGYNGEHNKADCNRKTKALLKAELLTDTKGVFITRDADGRIGLAKREIENHIPSNYKLPIRIGVFRYEIEDLIILDQDNTLRSQPYDYLKRHERYKKNDLPSYATKLSMSTLTDHQVISELIDLYNSV